MDIFNSLGQLDAVPSSTGEGVSLYDSNLGNTASLQYTPVEDKSPIRLPNIDDLMSQGISPDVTNIVSDLRSRPRTPKVVSPDVQLTTSSSNPYDLRRQPKGSNIANSQMFGTQKKFDRLSYTPTSVFNFKSLDDFSYDSSITGKRELKGYDNYIQGSDNEHMQGLQQGFFERAGKGITALAGKSIVNAIGGTVGVVNGLKSWVEEGSFRAFYDNDFSKYLDKVNADIDNHLAIHKTQEERNYNFLQNLTSSSFWFKDVADAGAFIVGSVIVGKGVGVLTKGLPQTAMKLASRGVGNAAKAITKSRSVGSSLYNSIDDVVSSTSKSRMMSASKEPVKQILRSATKNPSSKAVFGAYKAGDVASRLTQGLVATAQIGMSATYEAGVEARQVLETMTDNYKHQFGIANGREPSPEEMREFMTDAVEKSNYVFAANLPLIAVGNMASVGKILNINTPKWIQRVTTGGKKLSIPNVKVGKDGLFSFVKDKTRTSMLKSTKSFLNAPFKEGVVEEGGQMVISSFAENYMHEKYNPDAIRENLSVMKSLTGALYETFGTKEGWNGIGIGMLVGGISNQVGRVKQEGHIGAFFSTDYGGDLKKAKKFVDAYNEQVGTTNQSWLTKEQFNAFKRFSALNAQVASENNKSRSKDEQEQDFLNQADTLIQHSILRKFGMEDFGLEQMNAQIDALGDSEITALGVDKSQIEDYKNYLKEQAKSNFELNKKSFDIAENLITNALTPDEWRLLDKSGFGVDDVVTVTAMEIALGYRSAENYVAFTDELNTLFGGQEGMFADALRLFDRLDVEELNRSKRKRELENRQKVLHKKQQKLQDVVVKKRTLQSEKDAIQENAEVKNTELDNVLAEQLDIQQELSEISAELDSIQLERRNVASANLDLGVLGGITENIDKFNRKTELSDAEIDAAVETVEKMDDAVSAVRQELMSEGISEDRKKHLQDWLDRYSYITSRIRQSASAYKSFSDNFKLRTDPHYAYNKFKSSSNIVLRGVSVDIPADATPDEVLMWNKLEQLIENSELTGADAFQLKANARILMNQHRALTSAQVDSVDNVDASGEVISNGLWNEYVNTKDGTPFHNMIAMKLRRGVELSDREGVIYVNDKHIIDNIVENLKFEEGDPLSFGFASNESLSVHVDTNKPFKEAIQDVVDNIIKSSRRLSKSFVDSLDKENIPTDEDYKRFQELVHLRNRVRKAKSGKDRLSLSREFNESLQEYQDLYDKINTWSIISGTVVGGVRLSDMLEVLWDLDVDSETSVNTTQTYVDLDAMVEDLNWQSPKRGRAFNVAQVYDIAMVSRHAEGGYYVLHNLSVNSVVKAVEETGVPFSVTPYNEKGSAISNASSDKAVSFKFKFNDEGGKPVVYVIRKDSNGNLLIPDALVPHLGRYKFMVVPGVSRNYQPLLEEVDGQVTQVASDFTSDIDLTALNNVRSGDSLSVSINLEDPYNKRLIQDYRNAQNDSDKMWALDVLKSKIVLNLKDSNGNVVSVMKADPTEQQVESSLSASQMYAFRSAVIKDIYNILSNPEEGGEIDLPDDFNVSVDKVLIRNPKFVINKSEDGVYKVVNSDLDSRSISRIVDVGYVQGGVVHTRGKTQYTSGEGLIRQFEKADKKTKTPIVMIDYNGEVIPYPVVLKTKGFLSEEFDSIVSDNETTLLQKTLKINALLYGSGVSFDVTGVTVDMLNEGLDNKELLSVREKLANIDVYNSLEDWVSGDRSKDTILKEDVQINIDLQNDAFASPKIDFIFPKLASPTNVDLQRRFNVEDGGVTNTNDVYNEELNKSVSRSNANSCK